MAPAVMNGVYCVVRERSANDRVSTVPRNVASRSIDFPPLVRLSTVRSLNEHWTSANPIQRYSGHGSRDSLNPWYIDYSIQLSTLRRSVFICKHATRTNDAKMSLLQVTFSPNGRHSQPNLYSDLKTRTRGAEGRYTTIRPRLWHVTKRTKERSQLRT